MRFLLCLLLLLGLVSSLLLGGLFWATPYATVAAGLRAPNLSASLAAPPLVLTLARYTLLRGSMAVVAAGCAGLLGLGWRGQLAQMARRLRAELRQSGRELLAGWRQLSRAQRLLALLLGGLALGLRGWLWLGYPITEDELTSYDDYVHPGLALTASNYSLPNNHILHNLLVGSLRGLPLPPDALQRLPAVLVGLGLLPLSYLGLLRYLRFGAATLALGVFTFMPMPAFIGVAGRGYGLQLAATVVGSLAVLELLRPGGRSRLPEAAFVASSVLGLYAVPTHAWVVLAGGVVLLGGYARLPARERSRRLARLALAAGGIGGLTALVYLPVGLVSGWGALLSNPYVQPAPNWPIFWQGLPLYLLEVVSRLWGHGRFLLPVLGSLVLVGPLVLPRLRPAVQPLGWLSWAMLTVPLVLVLARRLYVPPRVVVPAALFSYVLLALLAQEGWRWLATRWRPWPGAANSQVLAIGALVVLVGGVHFWPEQVVRREFRRHYQAVGQEYAWLRAQHPQRVWLDEASRAYYGIYLYHVGLVRGAPLPLAVAAVLPTVARSSGTEYVVVKQSGTEPNGRAGRAPVYADAYICVWQLPRASKR
ncbi:MAG: hypothetical protein ACRYFX_17665 [Janthinobacterium lividum]